MSVQGQWGPVYGICLVEWLVWFSVMSELPEIVVDACNDVEEGGGQENGDDG